MLSISRSIACYSSISLILALNLSYADESVWRDVSEPDQGKSTLTQVKSAKFSAMLTSKLDKYRLLELNEDQLKSQLSAAGSAKSVIAGVSSGVSISLPLPDGTFTTVEITPTKIISDEVAKKVPNFRSWDVKSVDGKVSSGVLDIGDLGFHAMLLLSNGDTVFIDPQNNGGTVKYISYSQQANIKAFEHPGWTCGVHGNTPSFSSALPLLSSRVGSPTSSSTQQGSIAPAGSVYPTVWGETLLTYDLALVATAEYTNKMGGTTNTFNQMASTVNRINPILKRDLSINLNLVQGFAYTNPSTDPYTSGDTSKLIAQNQSTLNSLIGDSKYDIGHVLDYNVSQGGAGLAEMRSVCDGNGFKAKGASITIAPNDASFDIGTFAHEIGHQLGADHTFNTSNALCVKYIEPNSAFEPGSGSSIMSYADGRCGTDSLPRDAMYHVYSIAQIFGNTHNGADSSCATKSALNNLNPTPNAGGNYSIPAKTPFILSGSATDPNNDVLSYSWEQLNRGKSSSINVDRGDNALIRMQMFKNTPIRTIPQISDLVGNLKNKGEVLPASGRNLHFALAVRDGKGGIGSREMDITVVNTGRAFRVLQPTSTTFTPNSFLNVSWDVAGTNLPPINCTAVDISLTTNNGSSFGNLLLNTPNDGAQSVKLPATLGTKNYIRVKCSNNIFFSLSATSPNIATFQQ